MYQMAMYVRSSVTIVLTAYFDDGLRWRSVSYADILFIYTESV